jgi:hypothetical protein
VRSTFLFIVTFAALVGAILIGRTYFGAEVGGTCNDFVLSCRATRGMFTINACVRTGPAPEDTFCSYACETTPECPENWTCDPAEAWSSVSSAVEDVHRVCRPSPPSR